MSIHRLLVFITFLAFRCVFTQVFTWKMITDDCLEYNSNGTYSCFLVPFGCTNSNCINIVKWQVQSPDSWYVDFQLFSLINQTSVFSAYTAIGFSYDQLMGNDSVCMCRTSTYEPNMVVETFYNDLDLGSDVVSTSNRSIGIFNSSVKLLNSHLVCSFSRLKSIPDQDNFFDISKSFYILVASGSTNTLTSPIWHHDRAYASTTLQTFQAHNISEKLLTSKSASLAQIVKAESLITQHIPPISVSKAHGCMMVIAWMVIASTGILFSRYHKYFLYHKIVCCNRFWLTAHRSLMVASFLITIASFLTILGGCKWEWVTISDGGVIFSHSIIGIVTIFLATTQTLIGVFYTSIPMSYNKRKIFHYTHRTVGTTTYVLAIVTIFLGVIITERKLGRIGWGLVVGWTIWSIILPLIIEISTEIIEGLNKNKTYEIELNDPQRDEKIAANLENYRNILNKIKNFLMVVHLIVSISLSTALIVFIIL